MILDHSPAAKFKNQLEGKILRSIGTSQIVEIYDILRIMENIRPGELVDLEVGNAFNFDKIQ